MVAGAPTVVVTGIDTESVTIVDPGRYVTVMEHIAPAARVEQVLATLKLAVAAVGTPTWTAEVLVFVTVMVCPVAVGPGMSAKVSASGLIATPGSDVPVPVREAVADVPPVVRVSVPVRLPVDVGAKDASMKHDAV